MKTLVQIATRGLNDKPHVVSTKELELAVDADILNAFPQSTLRDITIEEAENATGKSAWE